MKRIFERLRDEYGFEGQQTIVKDYVRERRGRVGEMFVPLTHGPGHAQCDFGEALAVIAGVEQKVHYFVLDLPHSDGCFVKAYPGETTEAFLDGHVSAFAFLGGLPQARDPRSYEQEDFIFDPIHYLPLLERKTGALDQAAPLAGWKLPTEYATLRQRVEARLGRQGKREYVRALRLMEDFSHPEVHQAVKEALRLGAIGFDAVKHLLLCRIEGRPAPSGPRSLSPPAPDQRPDHLRR